MKIVDNFVKDLIKIFWEPESLPFEIKKIEQYRYLLAKLAHNYVVLKFHIKINVGGD